MVRLTREVRCTIPISGPVETGAPGNGLAGNLPENAGVYCVLRVTLSGELDPRSCYIENIKTIDDAVRQHALPSLSELLQSGRWSPVAAVQGATEALVPIFRDRLHSLALSTNPCLWATTLLTEQRMTTLTQRFEFSAAHRLHNPRLDAAANRELFGKCNNADGHGHNYEFEVTLAGTAGDAEVIAHDRFTQIVNETVIDRFDHKHLNVQTAEFADTIPSVENIAMVIHRLLKAAIPAPARLQSVRVWETGKTWAEYCE